MIEQALSFLQQTLSAHLQATTGNSEQQVVLSSLTAADGTVLAGIGGKLVLTLIRTQVVPHLKSPDVRTSSPVRDTSADLPALDLLVLMSADPHAYSAALQQLSSVLLFFNTHPVFTPAANALGFPSELLTLQVDYMALLPEAENALWSALRVPHRPYLLYRVSLAPDNSKPSGVVRTAVPPRVAAPPTSTAEPPPETAAA